MARFIVIEGIDGSGTSTQARRIAEALRSRGEQAVVHAEPTDRPVGLLVRELLAGRIRSAEEPRADRRLFAYLFAADRHDHIENREDGVKRHLADGVWVVCARYVLSSYAYEGESAEELHFVEQLNRPFPIPDLTVYLDCPVDVALARLAATRTQLDVFENREKLTRVRTGYEKLLPSWSGRRLLVDATRPAEQITAEVMALLNVG